MSGIFIYGHASTGKSLVIRSVLQELKVNLLRNGCILFYIELIRINENSTEKLKE